MRWFASIFAVLLAVGLAGCGDEPVKKETKTRDSTKETVADKMKAGAEKAVDETKKAATEAVDKAKAGAEKAVDETKKAATEAVDKTKAGTEKMLNEATPDAPKDNVAPPDATKKPDEK